MMKKVIAINGSPRRNGNTAELLQQALKGAQEAGAETESRQRKAERGQTLRKEQKEPHCGRRNCSGKTGREGRDLSIQTWLSLRCYDSL